MTFLFCHWCNVFNPFLLTCVDFLMSLKQVLLNKAHVTLIALERLFTCKKSIFLHTVLFFLGQLFPQDQNNTPLTCVNEDMSL